MSTRPSHPVNPIWQRLRHASHLIGFALFVWIVAQLDLAQVGATLAAGNVSYLILYVALFAGAMLLRTVRLHWVLACQGCRVSARRVYFATVEAALLGMLTPGRAGEAIKIVSLRQADVPIGRGFLAVVLERIFDLVVFLLIAFCGALYFANFFTSDGLQLALAVLMVCASGASLVYFFRRPLIRYISSMLDRLGVKWGNGKLQSTGVIFEIAKIVLSDTWRGMLAFSLVIGVLGALEAYCLALTLGVQVNLLHLIFSYSVAALVALVPISINGLGTREAAYIFFLGLASVGPESATLLSLLDGMVLPLLMITVLAIPLWVYGENPFAKSPPSAN